MQHRETASGAADKSDGIGVVEGRGDHPLMVLQAFDGADPVPQLGRPLKAKVLGRLLHLRAQHGDQFPALSLQNQNRLVAAAAVILLTRIPQAPACAFFHMVVEAGTLFADIPREDS